MIELLKQAKAAKAAVSLLTTQQKNDALEAMAASCCATKQTSSQPMQKILPLPRAPFPM